MGSLKKVHEIETIALNWLVFEKIAFLCTYFNRQTDKQMDRTKA